MEDLQLVGESQVNFYLYVGHTLQVTYNDEVLLTKTIEKDSYVTVVKIYEFTEFDGVKNGYLVVIGEE